MSLSRRDGHPLDDIAVYALDALDPDERAAVDAHLETCDTCRAELDLHFETLAQLTEDRPAPAGQRARIMGMIGAGDGRAGGGGGGGGVRSIYRARHLAGAERGRPTGRAGWSRGMTAGIAAAAAAIAAVGGFALGSLRDANQPADLAEQVADLENNPDARVATLQDAEGQDVARVLSGEDEGSFVVFDDLPVLDPGQTYQLWRIDTEQPVSLGIVGDGSETVPIRVPEGVTAIAISVEPNPNGSIQPSEVLGSGEPS